MDYERDLVAEVQVVLGDIFASARDNGLPSADLLRIASGLRPACGPTAMRY